MNINEERRKECDDIKSHMSEMEHEEFMETIDKVFKLIEEQDRNPKKDDVSYFLALQDHIEVYNLMLFELSRRKNQAISDYREFL